MDKRRKNKLCTIMMLILTIVCITACSSSEPCSRCGTSPTKSYTNEYTGQNEYFCNECSSKCSFCGQKASKHYTSAMGLFVFACNDCYQEVMELNQ